MENDWVTPFNGYKYKLGLELMDWNDSYSACQSLGGNLASIGIQSVNVQMYYYNIMMLICQKNN